MDVFPTLTFRAVIPIGTRCATTSALLHYKLRYRAYPFDSTITTLSMAMEALQDQFRKWLPTPANLKKATIKDRFVYVANDYGIEQPHLLEHDLKSIPTVIPPVVIDREQRRTTRCLEVLNSPGAILFLSVYLECDAVKFRIADVVQLDEFVKSHFPLIDYRILCLVHKKNAKGMVVESYSPSFIVVSCHLPPTEFTPERLDQVDNPLFQVLSKLKVEVLVPDL